MQVFWGQEHLNCLRLVQEYLQAYLQRGAPAPGGPEEPCQAQPPPSPGPHGPGTEVSSDDLRTGLFQYIQDTGGHTLLALPPLSPPLQVS